MSRAAVAGLVATGLVAVAIGAFLVVGWPGDESDQQPGASSTPSGWPAPGASRTVTEVRSDGSLEVTHRIHTEEPINQIELFPPDADASSDLEVSEVEVVAGGETASGPDTISFITAPYLFDDATTILVRYRLEGAIERSTSVAGRALVTTTALTVSATQPDDTRVVRSAAVLTLACAPSPAATLAPCGEAEDTDQWRVRLTGSDAGSRVVASVTVPS